MFSLSRVFYKSMGQTYLNSSFYTPEYVFSQENVQRTVANFSKVKLTRISKETHTRAAVFIPLCEVDGKVAILYTLRAAHLKSHRSQVSFPGGKQDSGDENLEQTAIRETVEELGIESDRIEVWGKGKWIATKYGTSVVPVIGRIQDEVLIDSLKTNPTEVEEVFTVFLEDICNPVNHKFTQFRILMSNAPSSTPVFLGGRHRIWGLTGYLTHIFLKSLLPTEAYTHPVRFVPPIVFGKPVIE